MGFVDRAPNGFCSWKGGIGLIKANKGGFWLDLGMVLGFHQGVTQLLLVQTENTDVENHDISLAC